MAKQRGLGRGLSSLIPDAPAIESDVGEASLPDIEEKPGKEEPASGEPRVPNANEGVSVMKCALIHPNPFQPRKRMNEDSLAELAASIKEHGVIQPVLIRSANDGYQIIAGERRWRAAQMAALDEVPVRLMEASDEAVMEMALVENLQRDDLSSIEIAKGIQDLISKMSMTHEEAADKIGMSRTAVSNKLRLLTLPGEALRMLESGAITEGHARALLALPEGKILDFAKMTVQRSLNVRQLEQLVRNISAAEKISAALPPKDVTGGDFTEEVTRINDNYRLNVSVSGSKKNMGVTIKGLKKWQVQVILEYIEHHSEELFPKE
ncbi:chromosome partitioning protein ParB [Synergistales bacterium]|nr:chromosome partitioning protein ParB [Synergistales bacterium]